MTIKPVLFALALLSVLPRPSPGSPPLGGPEGDAVFTLAVEAWVYGGLDRRRFDSVLPAPLASAVRGLACEHGHCRDTAEAAVLAHTLAVRGAFWAAVSKDAEVAHRGRRLLRVLLRCRHCNGVGVCPRRTPEAKDSLPGWYGPCPSCDAAGVSRYGPAEDGRPHDWSDRCLRCGMVGHFSPLP